MQQLQEFMDSRQLSKTQLAQTLRMDYGLIWRVVHGQRKPSARFRWRFAEAFGFEVAQKVLGNDGAASIVQERP